MGALLIVRSRATQSCFYAAECYSVSMRTGSVTAEREGARSLLRDSDKLRLLKNMLRRWVSDLCLVSHCSVWMRLAPFFHNTSGCAGSTCDTDRFMSLFAEHSTALPAMWWCIPCTLWIVSLCNGCVWEQTAWFGQMMMAHVDLRTRKEWVKDDEQVGEKIRFYLLCLLTRHQSCVICALVCLFYSYFTVFLICFMTLSYFLFKFVYFFFWILFIIITIIIICIF